MGRKGHDGAKRLNGRADMAVLRGILQLRQVVSTVDICYQKEGTPGQPGLVRHCEGKLGWANEKLLTIDPINHSLSYEILENNIGFKNYIASLKVLPIMEGESKPAGCKIEWSFISDPVEGLKLEDLVSYIDYTLQFMAKKMEDAVKAQI